MIPFQRSLTETEPSSKRLQQSVFSILLCLTSLRASSCRAQHGNWPAWVITSASGPRSICSKEISRAGFFFQHQPPDPPALDESVQHSLRMQKWKKPHRRSYFLRTVFCEFARCANRFAVEKPTNPLRAMTTSPKAIMSAGTFGGVAGVNKKVHEDRAKRKPEAQLGQTAVQKRYKIFGQAVSD